MEVEKVCKNCDHYYIQTDIWGECQKPGSSAEMVNGKLVSGDFKLATYTCSDFKPKSTSKTSRVTDYDSTDKQL